MSGSKLRNLLFSAILFLGFSLATPMLTDQSVEALSGSDFQAGRIMDDSVFFNANSMSEGQIQEFLNAKLSVCDTNGDKLIYDSAHGDTVTRRVYSERRGISTPFTCLKDYWQDTGNKSPEDMLCNGHVGGNKSAARIIKDVADSCGVSPKVLIILLQKEQSLVTDDWPWPRQYRSATGYGCPDTAPCDAQYYGFFNQVYNAARIYKYYAKYPNSFNHVAGRNNNILYNPNSACGRSTVFIHNQATAGLYNYTPYQPNAAALNNLYGTGDGCSAYGNRNFWRMYNDWFGHSIGWYCSLGAKGTVKYGVEFGKVVQGIDHPNLLLYDGTSTNCIEAHAWNNNFASWRNHIASNHRTVDPVNSKVLYGDINGDGIDEPILVGMRGTGSGMIEFHVWRTDMKSFQLHRPSNQPVIDPANSTIMFADTDGDGRDEAVLVGMRGTGSGMIEFHVWNPGMNTWRSHTASNQKAFN